MPSVQTTISTIPAGPGNSFCKATWNSFNSEMSFTSTTNFHSNTSCSSASGSQTHSARRYATTSGHKFMPAPIARPSRTKKASVGLGLGLPGGVLQRTLRANAYSFPKPTNLNTSKTRHGLGISFAPIPRPVSTPVETISESERLELRRSSVSALIGLGIYIPTVPLPGQSSGEVSSWSGNTQSDHSDYTDQTMNNMENGLPSPPLLPTRRSSPTRITTILDDDVTPPVVSIFSPNETPSEFIATPRAPRISFREAPPAEDLPVPFAPITNISRALPSANTTTNLMMGLGIENLNLQEQGTITFASAPSSVSSSNTSLILSGGSNFSTTSFVFQPFTPIAEEDSITTASTYFSSSSEGSSGIELDTLSPLGSLSSFSPPSSHFFDATPTAFTINGGVEPTYHLPTNLLVSPPEIVSQFASGYGLGFSHIVYETATPRISQLA
ncbi:unnamed protein product [Somion occarium]|uniref:Uncharacterized protein n=1 Tax=Somion occarium TaxID=3059160 RepID=A0ABP1E7W7_9APHY